MTEFSENSLPLARKRDQRAATKLVEVLYDRALDLNMFKRIFMNLKDCVEVSSKST